MTELLDMVNKKGFADVIKLRLLRWEIILDYLGLALMQSSGPLSDRSRSVGEVQQRNRPELKVLPCWC